jgi:small-conductance mechanosensitive channel
VPKALHQFLAIQILALEKYSITIQDAILIVPIIVAGVIILRIFTRIMKKRNLSGNKIVKTITRVLRIIVFFFVFLGIMRVLGVQLGNIFDFIKAVLSFRLFTLGGTDVSLLTILIMAVVVYISTKLAALSRNYFNSTIFPRFKIEAGLQSSLSKLIGYTIIAIGIIIALQGMGIKLSALTVFAGVLGVGIGFGMQNITANMVSGIVILFERPIKEGDMVRFKNTIGYVQKINLRATVIRTILNEHLIVPNTEFINATVENMSFSDLKLRLRVEVGVSYSSDPYMVKQALLDAAYSVEHVLRNPEPNVLFVGFGESSLNFQLLAWIENPKWRFEAESNLHFAVVQKFRERGITIPFPQRDVHIKQEPSIGLREAKK